MCMSMKDDTSPTACTAGFFIPDNNNIPSSRCRTGQKLVLIVQGRFQILPVVGTDGMTGHGSDGERETEKVSPSLDVQTSLAV